MPFWWINYAQVVQFGNNNVTVRFVVTVTNMCGLDSEFKTKYATKHLVIVRNDTRVLFNSPKNIFTV